MNSPGMLSNEERINLVLKVVRGADVVAAASNVGVPVHDLKHWVNQFLGAGWRALQDGTTENHTRAKQMEKELQDLKLELLIVKKLSALIKQSES